MDSTNETSPSVVSGSARRSGLWLVAIFFAVAVATIAVLGVLVTMFERKQEAKAPFVRLVEVDEISTDPERWRINWPHQYDGYQRTVDSEESEHGGSSALPESKLEKHPWLRRLYAGYAFSLDYRQARGHAYMLHDQEVTRRVTERPQTGSCLHCHASVIPTYRRLGLEHLGQDASAKSLAAAFNLPAVMEGFRLAGKMDYASGHDELLKTPDDTAHAGSQKSEDGHIGHARPVSCIDCHDPATMRIRVTRPGFIEGIAALANSQDDVAHLPSIVRWRDGDRKSPYDPNELAGRQELRTFVCAQCHVEYYCANKEPLFFPWHNGLKVEQIEATYDGHKFPDGTPFYDFKHEETGAAVYKAQHPEFELWSQGIHARSGVACADCHMPYERHGAMKVSSHWVRSPLLSLNKSCQTCHHVPEADLRDRVRTIQNRTDALMERAAAAMTDMLDAIRAAKDAGVTDEQLVPVFDLQRKGMWRLDFVSSENSHGFHADQESARILGESIDYCRQAQALAIKLQSVK